MSWLMKVADKIRAKPETLHLCVQVIDFILIFETRRIDRHNFQLLGITSLFVACKYN